MSKVHSKGALGHQNTDNSQLGVGSSQVGLRLASQYSVQDIDKARF